jgi:hypothetical protein
MILYTNKFPITTEYPCIQKDGKLDKELDITFQEGCIFKVKCLSGDSLMLECKGRVLQVFVTTLNTCFVETEVDV